MTTRHPPSTVADLDDTSQCPSAEVCERCHVSEELAAVAVDASLGVACVTLCRRCRRACSVALPGWSGPVAAWRAGQHCHHLGIERDTMLVTRARDGFLTRPMWVPAT